MLSNELRLNQQNIIRNGKDDDAYVFAMNNPECDIKALQQVIIDRGTAQYAHFFAKDVPGADIAALQKVVIERGKSWNFYFFARDIPGAEIQSLYQATVNSGNKKYCDDFISMMFITNRVVEMFDIDSVAVVNQFIKNDSIDNLEAIITRQGSKEQIEKFNNIIKELL